MSPEKQRPISLDIEGKEYLYEDPKMGFINQHFFKKLEFYMNYIIYVEYYDKDDNFLERKKYKIVGFTKNENNIPQIELEEGING